MKTCVLLAPGPSLTREICDTVRAQLVGVIGNAFELCPDADFLVATDAAWWRKHPAAMRYAGARFSASSLAGVQRVTNGRTDWSSGVLALQTAVNLGATHIELYGFDMHGTHFFGPYENGLTNTTAARRSVHQRQFSTWKLMHPDITVRNRTEGSQLQAYPCHAE